LIDEIDDRSAESRQVRVENVPAVVNSSFTDRKEAQIVSLMVEQWSKEEEL